MPDHTGALLRRRPRAQPLDDLQGRAVLLVAADDLRPPLACVHEQGAVAHDVQQGRLGEHPLDQQLLPALLPQRRLVVAVLLRVDVPPGKEELLLGGGDASEFGLVAGGADQELVRVEQPRLALAQTRLVGCQALIRVAHELPERLVQGIRLHLIRLLALHHHQGQAVHEKHDVGDDAVLHSPRRVDAELRWR
jgi:hypothetical protein